MAPSGKLGMGKEKSKILKIPISCFLFSSPGLPDHDWHRLAKPGLGKGTRKKVRYLGYLFLVFFSADQGSPDQDWHRLASLVVGKGKGKK